MGRVSLPRIQIGRIVELRAKSGKSLSRYFPDLVAALKDIDIERLVVDGELAIPTGDTAVIQGSANAPASGGEQGEETCSSKPAILILFDCLTDLHGATLISAPFRRRRAAGDTTVLRLTPFTHSAGEAQRWLDRVGGALDGVVAKKMDGRYRSGRRDMLKVKQLRTADCLVGGFRYEAESRLVG